MKTTKHIGETEAYKALLQYAQSYNLKSKSKKEQLQAEGREKIYVIYARKSTEDEKRQVYSVQEQIDICSEYAETHNLRIGDIRPEERSAKIAGKREVFREILDNIMAGHPYNSILTWHPDRLARNMKEAGEILDMLDNNYIEDLVFTSASFTNDASGKLMLSMLFAMAKEFSDKLSVDTIRGLDKKVEKGLYVGAVKKGYIPNTYNKYRPDTDTFEYYKNSWKLLLEGKTQVEILKYLQDNGIEDISRNVLSRFFKDPFYAGIYSFGKQVIELPKVDARFTPMVTPQEFVTVQKLTKEASRSWRLTDEFKPFEDLVYCNACGNKMSPYVNSNQKGGQRYLRMVCVSRSCKEKRRLAKKTPITNEIRGFEIIELFRNAIESHLKVNEELYEKARKTYIENNGNSLESLIEERRQLKISLKRRVKESIEVSDAILTNSHNKKLVDRFSEKFNRIQKGINEKTREIEKYDELIEDLKTKALFDFPSFSEFLNFFKNVGVVLENTDDTYIHDQLVKLVFLNIFVEDKKVVRSVLQEPFNGLVAK